MTLKKFTESEDDRDIWINPEYIIAVRTYHWQGKEYAVIHTVSKGSYIVKESPKEVLRDLF